MIYNGVIHEKNGVKLVSFNDFDFKNVKRFYIVKHTKNKTFRGWHGHKKEGKYVLVIKGKANIYWQSMELKGMEYGAFITLSADNQQVVYIEPGYANASLNLTRDTEIMYFSTATLEESKNDDIRFPRERWRI